MITRFNVWLRQSLCGLFRHKYEHIADGFYECIFCEKEMPDDQF